MTDQGGAAAASAGAPSGGSSGPVRRIPHAPLTPVAVVGAVFAIVVVTQLVVIGWLGTEAAASSTTQVCQVNFWVFHVGCGTVTTSSPSAQQAAQLASTLTWVFAVMDVFLFVLLAWVALAAYKAPSGRARSRQIGR